MIEVGAKAPPFKLQDHLGRTVASEGLLGRRHVLLCFYPLDFTPT
ncbi:MAG: redoxin domain-containing protein [Alphaproteobacteria bacterium]|nr:redoxin domain-containing protein [Alphaproteobacteria bacterium]MCB9697076.1 redoxin domain-containing protein [Alphaproteobacteria bacterium]